jgi:tRNA pseudouridine55 synthase
MYSAIKIGGQKLYDLARQGITVERQPRPITIHSIQVLKMEGPKLLIDVSCSKGTYIRSLCADIGLRCGSVAVMTFLLRSGVGSFRLESAVSLEEISENPALAIIPADTALVKIPSIVLSHSDTARFLNGQKLNLQRPEPSLVKVYGADETFIGIGSVCSSLLVPEKVFPPQ